MVVDLEVEGEDKLSTQANTKNELDFCDVEKSSSQKKGQIFRFASIWKAQLSFEGKMLLALFTLPSSFLQKALEESPLPAGNMASPPQSQISQHLLGSCSVLAQQWLHLQELNSDNMES